MKDADNLLAVQRMQAYIEVHLQEKITLKALATAAEYSPWHAARLFKVATGKTPFEYIRAMRLTKAALVIRDQDEKILDVALDFVFDSHEGFTRAHMNDPKITKSVFVQVIERPSRKILLKRGIKAKEYFAYCEEVGCDVWSVLTSVKEALFEPIGMWMPNHLIKTGTSVYVQGVEVPLSYDNVVPEGYELIELPPCLLMVFQSEPHDDEDFASEIHEVWQHIEKFDPKVYGYEWDPEAAPRFQLSPEGYRGYIEARPVKKIG